MTRQLTSEDERENEALEMSVYVDMNRHTLTQAYGDHSIAIIAAAPWEFVIVGHDDNSFRLRKKMQEKFPDEHVYITSLRDNVGDKR